MCRLILRHINRNTSILMKYPDYIHVDYFKKITFALFSIIFWIPFISNSSDLLSQGRPAVQTIELLSSSDKLTASSEIMDFSGPYQSGNWTFNNNGGNGSFNFNGTSNVTIVGDNSLSGVERNVDLTIEVVESGLWTFDWDYSSGDSGPYDNGGYLLNGVFTWLGDNDNQGSGTIQINVTAGDIIGYRLWTEDGRFGAGTLSITNFNAPIIQIVPGPGNILYVNQSVPGGNGSGDSWDNAISELADALNWVHNEWDESGTLQVWVAMGSYFPTPFAQPLDNGFRMKNNVAIFGGFSGSETELNQRNWIVNTTILNGNNTRRVVTNHEFTSLNPLDATAVLDGFVLQNGFDSGSGGAIYNQWASPTLSNLIIRHNSANVTGGAIYNINSQPTLSNVSIHDNSSASHGGGIYNSDSSPILNNVKIYDNISNGNGGGIANTVNSNPVLVNTNLSGNMASAAGGGMYSDNGSKPELINVLINGNVSSSGGGMFLTGTGTEATLTNITISGNSGLISGGGVFVTNNANTIINNTIIWGNQTGIDGSASSTSKSASIHHSLGFYSISHSLVANFETDDFDGGTGNLGGANNPLFANAPNPPASADSRFSGGDYSLSPGSPAINAGNNALYISSGGTLDDLDFSGNSRVNEIIIDLGALESLSVPISPTNGVLYVKKYGAGDRSGSSWSNAISELSIAVNWMHNVWDGVGSLQIWVASAIYSPVQSAPPLDNGFRMRNNVAIYGGFNGTEHSLEQRNWQVNETILDGGGTTRVIVNWYPDGPVMNSTAVLDGFTIRNGHNPMNGGGIYNENASPTLTNLYITNNWAGYDGGGMFNTFESSPLITNVTIANNTSARDGGGMMNSNMSNPFLANVKVIDNVATNRGGGIFNSSSSPILTNVIVSKNTSLNGGIYNSSSSNPVFTNVTVTQNTATEGGFTGGIYTATNSTLVLRNSIVFNNTRSDNSIGNLNTPVGSTTTISYSLIQGDPLTWNWNVITSGVNGGGNIISTISPFSTESENDFRLPPGSPAIFAGNADYYLSGTPDISHINTDVNEMPRFVEIHGISMIDMGAHQSPGFDLSVIGSPTLAALVGQEYGTFKVNATPRTDTGFESSYLNSYPLQGGSISVLYTEIDGATLTFFDTPSGLFELVLNEFGEVTTPVATASGSPGTVLVTFGSRGAEDEVMMLENLSPPEPGDGPSNALHFDGSGDYVMIADHDALDFTNDSSYTIEMWIKPDGFSPMAGLISKYHTGGANGYFLRLSSSAPYSGLNFDGMTTEQDLLEPGVWYHIAAVKNGVSRTLYVNGVQQTLSGTAINISQNNNMLSLGMDFAQDPRYFNGSMDEVRLWNVARTPEQIRVGMYEQVSPISADLVAYYSFNSGSPGGNNAGLTTVKDFSGNDHDGTAIGFALDGNTSNWVESFAMVVPNIEESTDISATGFRIQWTAPVHNTVTSYKLDVSTDANFTAFIDGYNGLDVGNVTDYLVTGLPFPTTYYFRITAVSATLGVGAPTTTAFTTTHYFPIDNILYVKSGGMGDGSGDSWDNAIPEVAYALRWARQRWGVNGSDAGWNDTNPLIIRVAAGTYYPMFDAVSNSVDGARTNAFVFAPHVQIFGHFSGNELTNEDRVLDNTAFITILNGDLGIENDDTDNSYHVVILPGDMGNARLDGLTITGGNASGYVADIIVNGIAIGNAFGGGVYIDGSSIVMNHVTVFNNTAVENGGGIYVKGSTLTGSVFSDVVLDGNKANSGGGIYLSDSGPIQFNNSQIHSNISGFGGGVYASGNNTVFTFVNGSISGNRSTSGGGGIFNSYGSHTKLVNSLVSGNAAAGGGGIFSTGSESVLTIVNTTISGNSSLIDVSIAGGGITNAESHAVIHNSIIWGNQAGTGGSATTAAKTSSILNVNATNVISNSLVANFDPVDLNTGSGNLGGDTDPMFVNAPLPPATYHDVFVGGDYNLMDGSTLINTGSNQLYINAGGSLNDFDLAGQSRVIDGIIDMGAFESTHISITPTSNVIYVRKGGFGDQTGSSWDNAISELADALRWARGRWESDEIAAGWDIGNPLYIYVAIGTYSPLYDAVYYTTNGGRDNAFVMLPFVQIIGGFDPVTDFDFDTRILPHADTDPGTFSGTILSGDLDGNDNLDNFDNHGENAYHVVVSAGSVGMASLSGVMVTNGYSIGAFGSQTLNGAPLPRASGAGVMILNSSPELFDMMITGNLATANGGGIYIGGDSNPLIYNVQVLDNTAGSNGGGIYSTFTDHNLPYFSEVVISGNTAEVGGGLYNLNSSIELNNVKITHNNAHSNGGGIYNNTSSSVFTNVLITENTAKSGGGMYNSNGGDLVITNVVISDNTATNTTQGFGGGIFNNGNNSVLTNTTITGNITLSPGGNSAGIHHINGTIKLRNSIIRDNTNASDDIVNFYAELSAPLEISHSLLQGDPTAWNWSTTSTGLDFGENIISDTPLMISETADYRLLPGNPGIFAGSTDYYHSTSIPDISHIVSDVAGVIRIVEDNGVSKIDMGALQSPGFILSTEGPPATKAKIGDEYGIITVRIEPRDDTGFESSFLETYPLEGGSVVVSYTHIDGATLTFADKPEGSFTLILNENGASDTPIVSASGQPGAVMVTFSSNGAENIEIELENWTNIIYVRQGGTGNGNTWDNATGDLQTAIDNEVIDQVWVAKGTYSPTENGFIMRNNVTILGGFPDYGNPNIDERDWVTNVTTLDGEDTKRVISNVFTSDSPLNETAVLDGFCITRGFNPEGGAIYNEWSSPSFSNLILTNNAASYGGGLLNINASSPILTDVVIFDNAVTHSGGGIYNTTDSNPILVNVTVSGNNATESGGGIFSTSGSSPVLKNVTISGNIAAESGGGIFQDSGNLELVNVLIKRNYATHGGGMVIENSSLDLINGVVALNNSLEGGHTGGMFNNSSTVNMFNTIIWNNTNIDATADNLFSTESNLNISFSLLQGNLAEWIWETERSGNDYGSNIITEISPFINESEDNFRLQATSPAINGGYPGTDLSRFFGGSSDPIDLDGKARVFDPGSGGIIDIGVYEYEGIPVVPESPILSTPVDGITELNTLSLLVLTWTEAIGAATYSVQLSTDADFSTTLVDISGLSALSSEVPVGTLALGTVYYWRVRGSNSSGDGEWSTKYSFTTMGTTPEIPSAPELPDEPGVPPGAEAVALTPTFNWTLVPGATSYTLELATDEDFTTIILTKSGLEETTYTLTIEESLHPSSVYWWRVRAFIEETPGDWSDEWSFETGDDESSPAPPSESPILQTPDPDAGGSEPEDLTPTVDWEEVGDATAYIVVLSLNPDLTDPIAHFEVENSEFTFPEGILEPNTTYYWAVYAINSAGSGPISKIQSFTTRQALPLVVTAIYPAIGQVDVDVLPEFSWELIPGHEKFEFQLSLDKDFETIDFTIKDLTQTTFKLNSRLKSNTTYYWRVRAVNNAGVGDWNIQWLFTTIPIQPPMLPTGLTVEVMSMKVSGMSILNTQSLRLMWNTPEWDGGSPITNYNIRYREVGSLNWNLYERAESIDTVAVLDGFESNLRYDFIVTAVNIVGESYFDESQVVTDIHLPMEIPNEVVLLQNYPNPFNPTTIIRYALPESGEMALTLYTLTGQQVMILEQGFKTAGWHSVQLNANHLASGTYIFVLKAGIYMHTKKLVLIK